MKSSLPFNSIYRHGFVRAAVCVPHVRICDPAANARQTLGLAKQAAKQGAVLALFPELGISAYSNDDLFQQETLLDAVLDALAELKVASKKLPLVMLVGAPLRFEGKLFNCAVAIHAGQVLGVVPKTYLPNYQEFYEKRQFASCRDAVSETVRLLGESVPFGSDLIFNPTTISEFQFHVELCEDLWAPVPPSTYAALAGATVLTNLSASNITIGKAEYRRDLCAAQSGKCVAAYLYSAAGIGESTTDMAWDGYALAYENNDPLAESERFSDDEQLIFADIDLERLAHDRMRLTSFTDAVHDHRDGVRKMRHIPFELAVPQGELPLQRLYPRFPFVPQAAAKRSERCYEAYNIQVHGLMQRLRSSGLEKLVIGVSGGLDSTQALIVAAQTMDRLGLPRKNILAYTLPGFGTSSRTYDNAIKLMAALGVTAEEIDIKPASEQMLKDIGHPVADGNAEYDTTFENVQAGQRTSLLFRLANLNHALVLGTGDLSELALGWCTYGVGDQMSHYNVNTSVPKTLIQYLIHWVIEEQLFDAPTGEVLHSILTTEISPELVPGDGNGEPSQRTEEIIGPYALQDFNTYFITRFGCRPSKVAFLSLQAWGDIERGHWPAQIGDTERQQYSLAEIKQWLDVFLTRFFGQSQFKRSAAPNGPKVGSGGSLSPRGDWRAPSDGNADIWLAELRENVPD